MIRIFAELFKAILQKIFRRSHTKILESRSSCFEMFRTRVVFRVRIRCCYENMDAMILKPFRKK